jgi:hypothetical protein
MIPLQRRLSAVRTTATIAPRFSVFLYYIHALRPLSEVMGSLKNNVTFWKPMPPGRLRCENSEYPYISAF